MNRLRIMILCGRSPRHLYVANRLSEAADVCAIVHESTGNLGVRSLAKKLKPQSLGRKAWRWLRDRRRYTNNHEAHFFFPHGRPRLARPELVRMTPHINHPDVVTWLDELQPDLVCVFGTSLIRGDLLRGGRLGIVNLHGGLSPEYRGADCTFWALYNGEPDKVGCTLHYINAGIDTGELIAHVCPEVKPGDDELTLFWRAVRESADVYAEFLQRVTGDERFGAMQPHRGRLYQVKDRGLRHERELAARMASGLLKNLALPSRVTWFTKAAQETGA